MFGSKASQSKPEAARRAPEVEEAFARLEALSRARAELLAPAGVLGRLIEVAFTGYTSSAWADTREERGGQVAELPPGGEPLFASRPPVLDLELLAGRLRHLCHALAAENPVAARVERALLSGPEILPAWLSWKFGAGKEPTPRLDGAGLAESDVRLVASLFRLALLPILASTSKGYGGALQSLAEGGGPCPLCGEVPALGELRGLERRLYLRCLTCAAAWPGRRMSCPVCREADTRRLGMVTEETEQERVRLLVCRRCGWRVVLVSTLGELSPPGLLVEELATISYRLLDDERIEQLLDASESQGT